MALSERHEALTVDPEVSTLGATPTEAAIPAKHDSTISPCVGVDGCGAGWLAVAKEGGVWSYRLHTQLADVVAKWPGSSQILVDIPIGLPWRQCPSRPCDTLSRRFLGRRAPSVFSPPTRAASRAADLRIARELNLREVGRSLSAQAWGICRKIAEADSLLLSDSSARSRVVEVHPELCFWALNARRPMAHHKASPGGRQERLALLERWSDGVDDLLAQILKEHRRSEVKADDVLDAVVACVTGLGETEPVAGETTSDEVGLPMQMLVRRG